MAGNAGSSPYYIWRSKGRYEKYLRVTTIIKRGVPTPQLVDWAALVTAEQAVDNMAKLYALLKAPDGASPEVQEAARLGAIDWLKTERYRITEKAALTGSQVHEAIEAYKLGKPYPGVSRAAQLYYDGFLRLLSDQQPIVLATEANVFHRKRLYAGTLDAIMVWPHLEAKMAEQNLDIEQFFPKPWKHPDGPVLMADYKSGKGPKKGGVYAETGLQLAAYRNAEFIGGPDGSEIPIPEIDGTIAIHLQPGYTEVIPVRTDEAVFHAFLFAYEVARWADEGFKGVVGPPLVVYEMPMGPENPDHLREQIGDLWGRLEAAEEELANPKPLFLIATSGRGVDPERHAVTDPPMPWAKPGGKMYRAVCDGQVKELSEKVFNPRGRNVCAKCAVYVIDPPPAPEPAPVIQESLENQENQGNLKPGDSDVAPGMDVRGPEDDGPTTTGHPCPTCGCECEPVEQVEGKQRPRWKCSNGPGCLGNEKGDGPWVSWRTDPWKLGGEVGLPRVPGPGQESLGVGV